MSPEEFVKDKPHDDNIVGYWIGFVDVKFTSIAGKIVLDVTDTSLIYPAVSEYNASGADFSYRLERVNGHYTHSYDQSSKNSEDYWYSGTSGSQNTVYDVFSLTQADASTRVDFDYEVFNTDTLIINNYNSGEKRLLVRIDDPSKIPSGLKIKE